MHGSEADKHFLWRMEMTDLLAYSLISFTPAACEGVFKPKTPDARMLAVVWGVLWLLPNRLEHLNNDLSFFNYSH